METKHDPLLLSIFLSDRLCGNSPLTESSVSKSIKWCPSCASPLIILLKKFGEESTESQFPVRALPEATCDGEDIDDGREAILTGGWYCRNCGLHILPFAPSMTIVSDPVPSDKQMPLKDSLELIDGGYNGWEAEIMSSCGQLLDHIRQAVSGKARLLDDRWKDMNEREARLRSLDRDLSGRVHGMAESEQRYQERLMKLNDYRDSLMRSIRIQLDDIGRREENLTRENYFKESTENQMAASTKPCEAFSSKTPETKVELSSEQKTDTSFSQATQNESSQNTAKKRERFAQEKFQESQNTEAAAEKLTEDDFRIINNSHSCKSTPDERFNERSPKFRQLLKNFEEQSSPLCNGFQRRFSQRNATWKNESFEVCAPKESGNITSYRDLALRNEDCKAIGTNEVHELRNREPLHKANLIGESNNTQLIERSFNSSLPQTKTWSKSPQEKRTETREHDRNSTRLNDRQEPMLARVSKAGRPIHNDLQIHCSSTPWPQNSTELHLSSLANVSQRTAPESYYLAYSNSLETSAFQSKLCNSDQLSNRRCRQNIKTDFAVHNFDRSISSAAQAYRPNVQQLTSSNTSQRVDQSDKSTGAIRPREREANGSHNRARSHSPNAFLDRNRCFATSNTDFTTQIQPLREAIDRKGKSYRFTETHSSIK